MREDRRVRPGRALSAGLVALAVTAAGASAQQGERYTVNGSAVAIYNLAGAVTIEAGTGNDVVVEVRRGGSDAQQLRVEQRAVNGRQALIVRYPGGDVVYDREGRGSRSTLQVRADGTFYGDGDGGERVTIKSSGSGTRAHADLRILVPAGRSLDVKLGVGEVTANGVRGDLDIDVGAAGVQTRATVGGLRIDTGSGAVTVTDAEGDLLVDTGSGSVQLDNVRGRDLNVDTGSGEVRGSGISAQNVLIDTGSGSVTLSRVNARDVEIDTGSGRVELQLLSDVERVLIDTGSGGVRLAVPEGFGGAFEVDASSISIDVPATFQEQERGYARGSIGDGRGSIRIDTGSGRVSIVRS